MEQWVKDLVVFIPHIDSLRIGEMLSIVGSTIIKGILWSSPWFSRRYSTRSLRQERSCSRMNELLAFTSVLFRTIIRAKARTGVAVFATRRNVDVSMQPAGKPDLEKMTQWYKKLFKFKNFYDRMDFNLEQRLPLTKAIIELINPSRSSGLIESGSRRNNRF